MKVFEATTLGGLELKNRIIMAPMTRSRAIDNIPNNLMKEYYSQRSSAGLILSEATAVSPNGTGYPRIPGAYTDEQIAGWKNIAKGIHNKGGKIFVQLFHTGRVSALLNLPKGAETIAPSVVPLREMEMYTDEEGMQPHDIPREMTLDDIEQVQQEYVTASIKLIEAGIDGIEVHAANGYLLEQFLDPKTNLRSDHYGGDYKKRARFVLQTTQKVVQAIGADKTGIRFSPYGVVNGMTGDYADIVELYTYLANELSKLNLAYIHIADQRSAMSAPEFATDIWKTIGDNFIGPMIGGGNVDSAMKAEKLLNDGYDLVYIGRPFIANPNLIEKLKKQKELVPFDPDLLYSPGPRGYTDWEN
ncbi:alkene reductase [Flagellimonas lutimaris]|uniref:alkene reductase n=1 Tax=Flagellimonas lutimaris TaxID=475082 RepID=UPI0039C29254|tara:strand:+ start:2248 stop:3324 length:1077 start_codon:yes stop_codon:yes gene_type:complete